jgi:hypothetical protein
MLLLASVCWFCGDGWGKGTGFPPAMAMDWRSKVYAVRREGDGAKSPANIQKRHNETDSAATSSFADGTEVTLRRNFRRGRGRSGEIRNNKDQAAYAWSVPTIPSEADRLNAGGEDRRLRF